MRAASLTFITLLAGVPVQLARADGPAIHRLLDPPGAEAREPRVYSLQLGAFSSLREASYVRSIAGNLGPVRVERLGPAYRVLLGRFATEREAEAFGREHRLGKLFPSLGLDVISSGIEGGPGNGAAEIPLAEQERDPRTLHLDLHCPAPDGGQERRGRYQARFTPEPGMEASAPPLHSTVDVQWSCATRVQERDDWAEKDLERNPSYLGVALVSAMGDFSASGGALGTVNLGHFSYGAQVSAFKSFGGIGSVLEYRVTNVRYSGGAGNPTPMFGIQHHALAGARLPFAHRFEVEPAFGFVSQAFLAGDSASLADAAFKSALAPQLGARARVRALELSGRASIDFALGYHHFLGATLDGVGATDGRAITAQLRARHFSPAGWGADWYFEYGSVARHAPGLEQGESLFRVGLSALFETR